MFLHASLLEYQPKYLDYNGRECLTEICAFKCLGVIHLVRTQNFRKTNISYIRVRIRG